MIDSHEIAERARLLSHRLYARQLREDARLLDAARVAMAGILASGGGTVGEARWAALLEADADEIERRMLDEGEEGRLLRANSPFSLLVGVRPSEDRIALWRQAKAELSASTISIERSAA